MAVTREIKGIKKLKYKGRIWTVAVLLFSGVLFKVHNYVALGYIPITEWILNALFIYPAYWFGLQYDKATIEICLPIEHSLEL